MKSNIIIPFKCNTIDTSTDKITKTLSKYTERTINEDKSVTYTEIETNYFLENDKWHIDFFGNMEQFKEQVNSYKYSTKNISFPFKNSNIKKEVKFIVYNKLFSDEWRLQTTIRGRTPFIRRLDKFLNEKYPNINSILDLDVAKSNLEWIDWLNSKNIKTIEIRKEMDKEYKNTTAIGNYLVFIINSFKYLIDEREEWEKDRWDVRNLEKYGITYNKSTTTYFIDFNNIDNLKIRRYVKKYIKYRLSTNNKFSWGTSIIYLSYIPNFINFICELNPTWNDLKDLDRNHIEKYIEWLNINRKSANRKDANAKRYIYQKT